MNHHGITPESLLNHPFREPKKGHAREALGRLPRIFTVPNDVYWKKDRNIKHRTGVKARERAFFGAATPVRARGQGFREWGGNSNPKRILEETRGNI